MTTITFEAGLFLRGQVRRELEKAQYLGQIGDFKEIKSLLESEFVIKDANAAVITWLKSVERQFEGV